MIITLEANVKGGSRMNAEDVRSSVQRILTEALKGKQFSVCVHCANGEPEGVVSVKVA